MHTETEGSTAAVAAVQPHFHAPKAVAYLRELARAMSAKGMTAESAETRWVAEMVESAEKFMLPPEGRLLAADVERVNVDLPIEVLRPPFPITVAEYSLRDKAAGPKSAMFSARHIVLMLDLAKVDIPFLSPRLVERARAHGGMGMIAIFDSDLDTASLGDAEIRRAAGTDTAWHVAPMMPVVLYEDTNLPPSTDQAEEIMKDAQRVAEITGQDSTLCVSNFGVYYWMALPASAHFGARALVEGGASLDDVDVAFRADTADEMRAALDFCVSLACKNIESMVVPAPAALNKKRAKAGKAALPSYRVLGIKLRPHTHARSTDAAAAGPRQSPRQHFRRGHIRRLHDGASLIWVSPALVGAADAGVVAKDYLLLI